MKSRGPPLSFEVIYRTFGAKPIHGVARLQALDGDRRLIIHHRPDGAFRLTNRLLLGPGEGGDERHDFGSVAAALAAASRIMGRPTEAPPLTQPWLAFEHDEDAEFPPLPEDLAVA